MRIATWNVNSIRVRIDQVCDWLAGADVDVLCMQELKAVDEEFPAARFADLGYASVSHGQPTYNGVAIVSRVGIDDPVPGFADGAEPDPQARLLRATCGGVRVMSAYCPNGEALDSPKFAYKREWFERLRAALDTQEDPAGDFVVVGDFNITPDDRDVWDPERLRGTIHCSDEERDWLRHLQGWGLTDCLRKHHEEAGIYSWWDYRMLAYQKRRGLRIDLVLASAPLAARCTACVVDKAPRKLPRPSDHAPVVADFAPGP